ncbi:MAG: HNH endonuclease [Nanoarchaeota archaeon]
MQREPIPKEIRKLVYEIYDRKCGRCSSEEFLNIHHIDRNPENNDIENLELLDWWCHWLEHDCKESMVEWGIKKGVL